MNQHHSTFDYSGEMCTEKKTSMDTFDCGLYGYHIHSKKLGEGGFGVVKLATHLITNQKVAVKIIDKEKIKNDLFRVNTEVQALKDLRHKNIARLLQMIETDDAIYLFMEYCNRGELFDYMVSRDGRRLSEPESRRIIRSLVVVLAYIHRKGYAHRDIKPENILLDDKLNIKLIDFGLCASTLSNPLGSLDGLQTCCGSPAYVAPELLRGDPYNGPAADIWSTGVLLFALLTGHLPFYDSSLTIMYKIIQAGNYRIPTFITSGAKDLISRMLCVDPKKRITLEEIACHEWIIGRDTSLKRLSLSRKDLLQDEEAELDENILVKCCTLFPKLDLPSIRDKIKNNFGYHRATYYLVKQRPELYPDFDQTITTFNNRRRSISFSENDIPKPLPLKMEQIPKDDTNDPNNNNDKKLPIIHKGPGTDIKRIRLNPVAGPKFSNKKVINKKLFTDKPNDFGKIMPIAEVSPIMAHDKRNNKYSLENKKDSSNSSNSSDNKENIERTPVRKQPRPSRSCPNNKTPAVTPKKSLFKWIKEHATPRKSSEPRRISTKDANRNVIVTNFKDPHRCRDAIVQYLKLKHFNCVPNCNTIRCVLSSMNVIIVAFELEILICRNTNQVAVQHNRIRGTSWDYVRICEDVKKELERIAMCTV